MNKPAHLVVLRFSAMGDVALTMPVIRSVLTARPEVHITLITRPRFAQLYQNILLDEHQRSRLTVMAADVDGHYAGLSGLWQLSRMIMAIHPDRLIDLHDHLRTRILRTLLNLSGIPVTVFDKGRQEKKAATGKNRINHRQPLKTTVQRYCDAFADAGYPCTLVAPPHVHAGAVRTNQTTGVKKIGIAPFAAHPTKEWPLERFSRMIRQFADDPSYQFILFGGKADREKLLALESLHPAVTCAAGTMTLSEELALMQSLSVMVCVDSSNMHLAGLCGIPTVSIWGGTHTVTGFGPEENLLNRIVEIPLADLPCRPCSVYGRSTCLRGDMACLTGITPEQVTRTIREVLTSV